MGNATLEKDTSASPARRTGAHALLRPTESGFQQLLRFGLAGAVATVIDYAALLSLFEFAHASHIVSVAAGYGLGLIVCYILSIHWIFPYRSMSNRQLEFTIFVVIGIIGLALTEIVVHYTLMALDAHPSISAHYDKVTLLSGAKFVAIVLVFFFNFIARKALLFGAPKV